MKTAAVFLVLPALLPATVLLAGNPPQNVRQDVTRLTLLPGPHLTSPAKGAPQPQPVHNVTEGMIKMEPERQFRFVPTPPTSQSAGQGTLTLGANTDSRWEFTPGRKLPTSTKADDLRFEAQLPPTVKRSLLEQQKRQPDPVPSQRK